MFNEEFKNLRLAIGFTQKQISEHFEVPMRTIQHWELGDRTPPAYVQKLLIRELNSLSKKNK